MTKQDNINRANAIGQLSRKLRTALYSLGAGPQALIEGEVTWRRDVCQGNSYYSQTFVTKIQAASYRELCKLGLASWEYVQENVYLLHRTELGMLVSARQR